jgi:predicted metal-binding membrane protein
MDRSEGKLLAFGDAAFAARAGFGRERAFLSSCAVLFALGAWGTIAWCGSMAGGMPMPGGWTMSMAWMRMPGQTWALAAAGFMGMWIVMMVPMMMPSLVPMLSAYRRAVRGQGESRLGGGTALAGAGYFLVWTLFGAAAYPLGLALAAAEMRWAPLSRAVPFATGAVLLFAGGVQLTRWKARQLSCCREAPACGVPLAGASNAFRHGLRLGVRCSSCCVGFMAILLAGGVMDLGVMAAVAAAITVERLSSHPTRAARALGAVCLAAGALAVARALGGV